MSYTLKEMFISLGYGIVIGTVVGATSISVLMPNLYQAGEKKGIEQGRAQATSNLVSAVESISEVAKKRLDDKFYDIAPKTKNMSPELLKHEISSGYDSGINSISLLTRIIKNNAYKIATGELKAQDTEGYQFLIEKINTEIKGEQK